MSCECNEKIKQLENKLTSIKHTLISDKWLIGNHAEHISNFEGFISFVEAVFRTNNLEVKK